MKERRRTIRYPFVAYAELIEEKSQTHLSAQVSELSLYGCYFDMINPFPVSTPVLVKIVTELNLKLTQRLSPHSAILGWASHSVRSTHIFSKSCRAGYWTLKRLDECQAKEFRNSEGNLPYFRNLEGYQQSASKIFSKPVTPGSATPQSGIYQCMSCGFEIVSVVGEILPNEQNCSDHEERWKCRQGSVRWRLVATPINTNG
jgi:hypothetical protein